MIFQFCLAPLGDGLEEFASCLGINLRTVIRFVQLKKQVENCIRFDDGFIGPVGAFAVFYPVIIKGI